MNNQILRFQNLRFKLFVLLLCVSILIGQAFLARPAMAEQAAAPHWVSPVFRHNVSPPQKPVVVSWNNPKKTFVFAVANSGDIWQKSLTGSTLAWSSWINLGVPPIVDRVFESLDAVSWTPGRIDVFGVDQARNVWHKFLINTAWSSTWEDLGVMAGQPFSLKGIRAISWAPGRLDVFAAHMGYTPNMGDNRYEPFSHKWWSNGWGPSQAGAWENLGDTYMDIDATSWGADRIDIIGKSRTGEIYHRSWDGSGWYDWDSLNGTSSSNPIVLSWGYNRLDIFIRGGYPGAPSSNVYHKSWNGTAWTAWKNIGGNSRGTPVTGVSWGTNRLDLFEVRGDYGVAPGVFHKAWDGTGGSPSAAAWEYIGGEAALSDIAATSWGPNRLDLFAFRNSDGSLWHLAWNGSAWTPSINAWDLLNP